MEVIRRAFRWHRQRFSAGAVVLGIIFWVIAWVVWGLWFVFLIIVVMVLEIGWAYGLERLHRGRRAE